jgi:peroxiredoxin family protein
MSPRNLDITMAPDGALMAQIERLIDAKVTEKLNGLPARKAANRAALVVFSSDMDKVMAAFVIAAGAAAMGMDVTMYFTFWGLAAIRKTTRLRRKSFTEKLTSLMLPSGPGALGTSKLNLLGMGPAFFKSIMKKKNVQALPDLIAVARESGVRFVACQMSMAVMGLQKEELMDGIQYGGVATYLADARDCGITLFI